MPGEQYGIPQYTPQQSSPWNTKMQGLLSDPLFNIGLGILANNNSKNFGQVVGRGAIQGLQGVQQQQALQAQMGQQAQNAQLNKLRQQRMEQEIEQQRAQAKAIEEATASNPELAQLFKIDPKAAIKALYPQANSADPYFTPIATEQGLGSYDNRTGKFTPLDIQGRPIIKSTDSPIVRGGVKEAEARATAGYNINTDIPGVVTTARQVAEQANPALGLPQITPQVQRGRDDKRMQILMQEQQRSGGAGANPELDKEIANVSRQLGIAIPTKAQEAGQVETAKLTAEAQAKSQINLPNVISEANNSIKLVDDLLKAPGFKQAVGGSRLFGVQNIPGTSAKDFDVRLEQLKGKQFLQAYETLKGAGAITDIEGTKAGNAIARMDASQSEEEFQKAAREFQGIMKAGVERAKAKAGGQIMPTGEPMPKVEAMPLPAKPSTLTLKKGTVYQTPKGPLRWNGKAFED